MKIDRVWQGITDKARALRELCHSLSLKTGKFTYISDDIYDFEVFWTAGLSVAAANAVAKVQVLSVPRVCQMESGKGCVRELVNLVMA